jgi:putative protease
MAIDDFCNTESPGRYKTRTPFYLETLRYASHRAFSTGFYFGWEAQAPTKTPYARTHDFVGIVRGYDAENQRAVVEQRNKFSLGDELVFIRANGGEFTQKCADMLDESGEAVTSAPHPRQRVTLAAFRPVTAYDMVCRKV